ncbi:MAG: hypothetical protein HRU09_14780 [Oligoflexales bacterium]|nr:hypothetical protein [Oligoflexales bacterium]
MKTLLIAFVGLVFIQASCTKSPTSFIKTNTSNKPVSRVDDTTRDGSIGQDGVAAESTDSSNGSTSSGEPGSMDGTSQGNTGSELPETGVNLTEPSLYNNVVWKRYRALENGMMRALSLSKQQLCNELDQFSCIDQIHLFNLGGNDPFFAAQGKRAADPTILTPVAVERLAMHACGNRIELDKAAGANAVVFTGFTLNADPIPADQISPLVTTLYQLFLARNPNAEEIAKLDAFAKQGIGSEQFAKTACFVIATMYENIFI